MFYFIVPQVFVGSADMMLQMANIQKIYNIGIKKCSGITWSLCLNLSQSTLLFSIRTKKNKKESPVLMVLLILIETKSKSQSEHIVILNQNEKNKKKARF